MSNSIAFRHSWCHQSPGETLDILLLVPVVLWYLDGGRQSFRIHWRLIPAKYRIHHNGSPVSGELDDTMWDYLAFRIPNDKMSHTCSWAKVLTSDRLFVHFVRFLFFLIPLPRLRLIIVIIKICKNF
jgi:hypothetical protein